MTTIDLTAADSAPSSPRCCRAMSRSAAPIATLVEVLDPDVMIDVQVQDGDEVRLVAAQTREN